MALVAGLNGGYDFGTGLTRNAEAYAALKPACVRLPQNASEWNAANLGFICNEEIVAHGIANCCIIISFDGEYNTTKVKGEKISKRFSMATLLAGIAEIGTAVAKGEIKGLVFIEYGNETSYGYQYGDGVSEASYKERAREYAKGFKEVSEACTAHGLPKPLCQADDGNSGSNVWIKEMYAQVANLHEYVGAWVIHPYAWEVGGKPGPRVERMIAQLHEIGGAGADALPIDVTEWGVSTDNGNKLKKEGTSNTFTYAEAASLGATQTAEIKAAAGSRLRQFLFFQGLDQAAHGATENVESYWGALTNLAAEKVGWTSFVKALLSEGGKLATDPARLPRVFGRQALRRSQR